MAPIIRCLCLCLLFFLAAASGNEQKQNSTQQIGIILPLSGPLAEYGQAVKNGFEIARNNSPELFQHISFVFEDSRYQPQDAVSAFHKLRRNKQTKAVYVWGNPTSEAVAPLSEKYKFPTLASVSNPKTSQGKNYVIRTNNHSMLFSEPLAQYIKAAKLSRVAVVLTENSYLNGFYDDLKQIFSAEGYARTEIMLLDRYSPSDHDFRSTVTKIKHGNFDSVAVFLMSGQVSQFYRQYAEQQLHVPTFGTDFFESTTEIESAGEAIQGAVYSHIGTTDKFRNDYIAQVGNDLQIAYAANAYDSATILAKAMNTTGAAATPEELMTAISSQKEHHGASGTAYYKNTKEIGAYFEFPVFLKRINGKSFEILPSP